ncbi:MAG: hypothetical protein ACRD4S_13150 [Candidatus Acidiferrales bacterium]
MGRDNSNYSTPVLHLNSLFRGMYNRIARKLRVDPSYVSRVARGERKSEEVQAALDREIKKLLQHANGHGADGHGHNGDGDGFDGDVPVHGKLRPLAASEAKKLMHPDGDGMDGRKLTGKNRKTALYPARANKPGTKRPSA